MQLRAKLARALKSRLMGERGDSFVSILIAGGLLSGTAVVGGGVMKLMRQDATYSSVMSTAIAAESAISQALQNPGTYANPAHTAAMRAGGVNLLGGVAITGERGILGAGVTLARIGGAVQLNRDGLPCSSGQTNPNDASFCAVTTNVQINCTGTSPNTTCRAAYQVAVNTAANAGVSVPPFGAAAWPPAAADFSTLIGYDLFRRAGAKTVCAPTELFVTGMDKANGTITCASPSDISLPVNGIPNVVSRGGAPGYRMQFGSRQADIASCGDSKYALQQVDPRNLDEGSGVSGSCIYRYQPNIAWMDTWPSGRDAVEMNVCPDADYTITPSGRCTMNVISQTNGYEPKICQDGVGAYYDCSEEPAPIIQEGVTYRIDQDPPVGATKNGARVSCTLVQFGNQPFGASWRGEVQWSGRCVLNRPQRIPTQRRPLGSP